MASQVIDFSGIKANFAADEQNDDTHLDDLEEDRQLQRLLLDRYNKEKTISDQIYEKLFDQVLEVTFAKVDSFVDQALDVRTLFKNQNAFLVQAATLILSLRRNDHPYSLLKLEQRYRNKFNGALRIIRIRARRGLKRADLLTILKDFKDTEKLLVIVEETETMDSSLLQILVEALFNMLSDDRKKRILTLFCMSSSFRPIGCLLPVGIMNRMDHKSVIVHDVEDLSKGLQKRLIASEGIKMKLGHKLIDGIYCSFTENDDSITNLKFLHQACMYEHYSDPISILLQDKKNMLRIMQQQPNLIAIIRDLPSMSFCQENLNWKNLVEVVNFCVNQVINLEENHRFITMQNNYLFELLKDETRLGDGITELIDVYRQLLKHNDLAGSQIMYDSINDIRRYPKEAILKRFDSALKHHQILNCNNKKSKLKRLDIHDVLNKYRSKLENNEESREIINNLITDLLDLLKHIKNPLKMPLCEAIYFDNMSLIRERTMPSFRYDIFRQIDLKPKNHFTILLENLTFYNEEISTADLFADFKEHIKKDRIDSISDEKKKSAEQVSVGKKVKRSKRSVHYKVDEGDLEIDESDDLLKAIFVDLIDCMEQQGLIKRNLTTSKKGMLKRNIWVK